MVNTRSKARSRQPLDRTASPRANTPRANTPRRVSFQTSDTSQQSASEGVDDNSAQNTRTFGGRLVSSAAGSNRPTTSRKCRSDCKTCPALVKNNSVKSNVTGFCNGCSGILLGRLGRLVP